MRSLLRLTPFFLWMIPFGFLLESSIRRMEEPDLFFYFALIQQYLKTGAWPTTDPFLYTLPQDALMSAHQWLGYWVFYLPYTLMSWSGPILLKTALVTTFFLVPLIPFWQKRTWPPSYLALVWTIAVFAAHHRFRERVSVFGDFFVLLLVIGLLWGREKRWFWYSLPVLTLLWAQMHPSWPLALVILGAHFLTQNPRRWQKHQLTCALLCLVTPLIHPLGITGYLYPFVFTRDIEPYLRQYIVEWLPLTDTRLLRFRFLYVPFFTLIPLTLIAFARQWRQTTLFEWSLFLIGIGLTIKSVRFGLLAQGLYLALLVHLELRQPLLRTDLLGRRMIHAVLAGLLSLGVIAYKQSSNPTWRIAWSDRLQLETGYFPEGAAKFLSLNRPKMHVFNSFGYGGYLAWRWQGDPPIFFHGFSTNFKFYEDNYIKPQSSRPELDALIRRYDIGVFMISKLGNDDPFLALLNGHEGFQLIFEDAATKIFAKRDARVFQ